MIKRTEYKVIWSEDLTERTRPDRVHSSRFQVDQDGSWDVLAACSLVEIDVDSLQLQIGVAMVSPSRVDSVLVRDDLPELGSNLVTALSGLYVYYFSHSGFKIWI